MAWVTKVALASLADVSAAALVSGSTQTRNAVDARVRATTENIIGDIITDDPAVVQTVIDTINGDPALLAGLSYYKDLPLEANTLTDLVPGAYYVRSTDITRLGLPSGGLAGAVFVSRRAANNQGAALYVEITASGMHLYASNLTSTGWQAWERMDREAYLGGASVGASAPMNNMDTLPNGFFSISGASVAGPLNVPISSAAVGFTVRFGVLDWAFQIVFTLESPSKIITRSKLSTTWGAWSDPFADRIPDLPASVDSGAGSGMKRVPLTLTLGQGTQTAPATRQYRIPFLFNAPITRWRLHITDRNPHTGEHVGSGINIGNVYVGSHASNGSFTAAPTRIGGAIPLSTLPDGEWVSAWRNEAIGDGIERILSYDYTSTTPPFIAVAGAYNTSNTDSSAVQFLDGNSSPLKWAAFDMWIEAETYSTTPVIAVFGDSLSSGAQATLPCHESVVSIYSRQVGALPVHYAVSGNAMQDWAEDPNAYKWTRWAGLDRADVVLWAMGHNDVYRGRSLSQMQADFDTCYPLMLARVAKSVVAATVTTRNSPTNPAMHTVRAAWNSWLLRQANSPLSDGRIRDVFDFAAVINDGDLIRPEFNTDDIHLNTAGYEAEAAAITRRITTPPVVYAN